ncbi:MULTISPECIES: cation diffusion facilitator family transporter [Paraburkholderia]|uniref:cation diffusion facilitator family transporter n=1 Tax=Paraburkholderia TaxID=1822464 RepID=UPI001CB3F5CE|nr:MULTISPECIES: cation transporter [Paraburkholderia]CAG9254037.1 hypothetical protein PCAR4_350194 [Paraburkholderia caribensis]
MKVSRRRSASSTPRAIYYALAPNIAVAACKYVVAVLTNSGASLAEAIHSSAGCLNQLIILYGHRRARTKPDEQHPFGFGREQYIYGMLVAMQLFVAGGLASVAVGIVRALRSSPLDSPYLAVGVCPRSDGQMAKDAARNPASGEPRGAEVGGRSRDRRAGRARGRRQRQ